MILTNELLVEAPIAEVWKLFDELETVLPCMPGAAYLGRNGDDERVLMKVKVGAITSNFEGTVRFVERDEVAHRVVIRGAGKDKGGKASASATIESQLEALAGDRTRVVVKTDLTLTGKLAQFGGGMITDIAHRLVDQFAENLNRQVVQVRGEELKGEDVPQEVVASQVLEAPPSAASSGPATPSGAEVESSEKLAPLDLGNLVGSWAWKQSLRHVAIPLSMFVLGWICARVFL